MTTQPPFLASPPRLLCYTVSLLHSQHWKGWGGGGWGRCRLLEGSALWLPLSNWLMTKASVCSWQAGASTPGAALIHLSWLGVSWWSWWKGLPSQCKGVKKEITPLHVGPNEVAWCYNVIGMHAHAHRGCIFWRPSLQRLCDTWEEDVLLGHMCKESKSRYPTMKVTCVNISRDAKLLKSKHSFCKHRTLNANL